MLITVSIYRVANDMDITYKTLDSENRKNSISIKRIFLDILHIMSRVISHYIQNSLLEQLLRLAWINQYDTVVILGIDVIWYCGHSGGWQVNVTIADMAVCEWLAIQA